LAGIVEGLCYEDEFMEEGGRSFSETLIDFVFDLAVQWAASVLKSTNRQQHLQNTLTVFQVLLEFLSRC